MRIDRKSNTFFFSGFRIFFLLPFIILLNSGQVYSASPELSENEVKASYLYNFAKFVEWPKGTFSAENSPLAICHLGNSKLNQTIELLDGKSSRKRIIIVKKLNRVEDMQGCHILFVDSTSSFQLKKTFNAVAGKPVLTVSDVKDFAYLGGMIELTLVSEKIRFSINRHAANSAKLQLSSNLLRLATQVIE